MLLDDLNGILGTEPDSLDRSISPLVPLLRPTNLRRRGGGR